MLAGVSTDYYIRLEQGRDQHPSPQVLDALSRAPQLDENGTAHLHGLTEPPTQRRRRSRRPERVPAAVTQLISGRAMTPGRQTLSIYHAAPGSPSERALALLATTTVAEREPEPTFRD